MPKPITVTSRAEVLRLIRTAYALADLAPDDDTKILLKANIMPKEFFTSYLQSFDLPYPRGVIDYLISKQKVEQTESYLRANPKDRTRPIATQYNIDAPYIPYPNVKESTAFSVYGKDRMALWYIGTNYEETGSRSESYGLTLLLRFFRLPKIQALYRKHVGRPRFKLPKIAQ